MLGKRLKRYVRGNQRSHWLSSWLPSCKIKCMRKNESTETTTVEITTRTFISHVVRSYTLKPGRHVTGNSELCFPSTLNPWPSMSRENKTRCFPWGQSDSALSVGTSFSDHRRCEGVAVVERLKQRWKKCSEVTVKKGSKVSCWKKNMTLRLHTSQCRSPTQRSWPDLNAEFIYWCPKNLALGSEYSFAEMIKEI